jgi:hypothetical protein
LIILPEAALLFLLRQTSIQACKYADLQAYFTVNPFAVDNFLHAET